ncbi:acetyl-CoA C-acetyltransferase [Glaciecola petra]|uniref:Acetyl-CoA C-acetyltransferase n=1 Tax=Glaciecola petra TaxID=3075602 RepID=A0ABU2ZYG4_9ALTE|nr:acetyl-CoA C-acetyltransferase [Aestuariibacter sp. P117]MDT0596467.1 acetyl-CoA C-acetyltransferase [Aestuariibacter sp. P117]
MTRDVFIYDAIRSPRGKGRKDGKLHQTSALHLSSEMLNALIERNAFEVTEIEDVIWGNVTQVGEQGACLARSAVLNSNLAESTPGLSINRFCASGLEAMNLGAAQIQGGVGEAYICGGVEMMGRVPMGSDGGAIAVDPSVAHKAYFVPQGISADIIATEYGFTREECDRYSAESQKRAFEAWQDNRFNKSVVPVKDINGLTILDRDEYIRPETTFESLQSLNPAFKKQGESVPGFDHVALLKYPHLPAIEHVHHAGNSSGIVDGAAAILVGSREFGERNNLKPRARIRAMAKIGSDPTINLTGPVPVTEKILAQAGLSIDDIDLFEVNEAFASVVLRFMQAFNVEHDKVNVNGGAIAMGHPLGATGAMLISTLLDELERSDKKLGLATLCVAAGMGSATILELV